MSVPVSPAPTRIQKVLPHAWWGLLLVALLVQVWAMSRRIDRVQALSDRPTWSVDAPARSAESATGWERGQRRQIVPGLHSPSFWWIREAQAAAAEGRWRVRHIEHDAVPDGRETSRTSPYRWWLTAVGAGTSLVTGESLGAGIETGARVADPLLWLLLTAAGTVFCAWRWGGAAAAGFAAGATMLFPLAAGFQPGAPDPHALSWVLATASGLVLLAAEGRRTLWVVAGLLGGVGLWNDAVAQMAVLLGITLGGLGGEVLQPRDAPVGAWRWWSVAGAATTVLASLGEFGAAGMLTSMTAVSPLHALVWLGMGEVLNAAGGWRRAGRRTPPAKVLVGLVGGLLAMLVWPVTVVLTETGGLLAGDFYAIELANHPRGVVAPDTVTWLRRAGDGAAKVATMLPVLGVAVALGWRWRTRRADRAGGGLVVMGSLLLLAVGLALLQLRWWNLVHGVVLVAIAGLFAGKSLRERRTQVALAAVLVGLLPGWVVGFPKAVPDGRVVDVTPREAQALIARDFAAWIALRAGDEPVVIFSTPIFADAVAYYGGFRAVVSSDPENGAGHLAAVRLASASTAQEVGILLQTQAVTHIALPLWDPGLDQLVRIGADLEPGQALPPNAFGVSLRWWDMPLTVQPMDYLIPKEPGFESFDLRAFAVGAEQSPELGLSRLADFFVERGQVREAVAMRENLETFARHPAVLAAMASIDFAARDGKRLTETLDRLVPMLSRRAARGLPPDRRVSLAALLARVQREDLAREQIAACMEDLDAETLCTWTPGTVVNLWALSRAYGIGFPDSSIEALALQLMPPMVRAGMTK